MKQVTLILLTASLAIAGDVSIIDPAVQMPAYTLKVPAGWTFDGTVLPGPSCAMVPVPTWRATGPDGIAEIKVLPSIAWSWGKVRQPYEPASAPKPTDCLNWNKEVSPAEFIQYMVNMLHVQFVRDVPIPDSVKTKIQESIRQVNRQWAAAAPGQRPATQSGDVGTALVRYTVKGVPVEEMLLVNVICTHFPQLIVGRGWAGPVNTCSGSVTRERAHEGSLEAMKPVLSGIQASTVMNPQWFARYNAAIRAAGESVRRVGQMQEQVLLKQGEDFIQATKEQGEKRRADFDQRMAEKSRVADDWCDYALDLQKRQDPGTGDIVKTSSQYSYTWKNEWGQAYNTNDANDDPNGRLKGNWTLQNNVR